MSQESLKEIFFAECEELIEELTEGLGIVATGDWDTETINAIFRAVHSIKGSGGAFNLETLVTFTHKFETVLDLIRSNKLVVDGETLRVITRSGDMVAELVELAQAESEEAPEPMQPLLDELEQLTAAGRTGEEEDLDFAPMALEPISLDLPQESGAQSYQITFKPSPSFYENGHEPGRFIAMLAELGELEVDCDTSEVPELTDLDADDAYLLWTITLTTSSAQSDIEAVFTFVEGLCELQIQADAPDTVIAFEEPDAAPALPDLDLPEGDASESPPTPAPAAANSDASARQKAGQVPTMRSTLRVDPERVDRLINTVGELIINQAVIGQKIEACGLTNDTDIMGALDDYQYLAREIQEGVMAIRAQSVKTLFQRMGRVVREAGEATNKQVIFVTEGETTEIDKTLIERLADPLTHMLRNSVDHGIEMPDARTEVGKPESGTVKLSAAHRSGHVVIEITDDGAGLNRERILKKAIENGIVGPDANLSEPEIDNLLFAPGFSTAESVSSLSGRGVGMDVVKTTITSLGGRISIASQTGQGSVFSISLPLTLAVLDGMVVGVGEETMVLPLSSVIETIRPKREDLLQVGPKDWVLSVRGEYVPVSSLGALFDMNGMQKDIHEASFVLVGGEGATSLALAVDSISDQRQVVIKSLEGNYRSIRGISAATILGDGKIALIVDVEDLTHLAQQSAIPPAIFELEA